MRNLGVTTGEAIRVFVVVTLASSAAYMSFALVYARLASAI